MVNKWCGLFSHTGKELETLASMDHEFDLRLGVVITNNSNYNGKFMQPGFNCYRAPNTKWINALLKQPEVVKRNSLVTLNGYMGILPEDVLDSLHARGCKVYNIHPAPIQLYPELRGKDPQERMYEGIQNRQYSYIGVVIHEVDAGVDTGKIVHWIVEMADHGMTKTELYQRLHELGTRAWEAFFRERMYEDAENH